MTQPINKHDAHTFLLVPKLGPVMTNHVREFYSFGYYYHYYYYCYYYYHHSCYLCHYLYHWSKNILLQ